MGYSITYASTYRRAETSITIVADTRKGYKVICYDQACKRSLDPIAKKMYQTIVKVQDFFLNCFGIDGIDGHGNMVPIIIHWNERNAAWSGQAGSYTLRFHDIYALTPEVIAHEYMHGIIEYLNPLVYRNQSGALNESLADVMGITYEWWSQGGYTDWKIGNLRNLSKRASMRNYRVIPNDNGGVHTNSAIPNHAFFLAVMGSGSMAMEEVSKIWFKAFRNVSRNASFKEFARKTVEIARRNYSEHFSSRIERAWQKVGVLEIPRPIIAHQSYRHMPYQIRARAVQTETLYSIILSTVEKFLCWRSL